MGEFKNVYAAGRRVGKAHIFLFGSPVNFPERFYQVDDVAFIKGLEGDADAALDKIYWYRAERGSAGSNDFCFFATLRNN